MSFLIAGSSGLLGSALHKMLPSAVVCPRQHVTTNIDGWRREIASAGAEVVLNCVAHTDVEGAERDSEVDFRINATVPAALASACKAEGIVLVHFSSTGCYGNWKSDPYEDADPLRPTTAHHRAKAAGEDAIRASDCNHLIFRLGWLFGGDASHAKNFVWKRLLEARAKPLITSDAVQRGCPSFVDDVAANVLTAVRAGIRGSFNLVAQGSASRFDYVASIVRRAGLRSRVEAGPAFERLAKVSNNEMAMNDGLERLGLNSMPHWEESLVAFVDSLLLTREWKSLSGDAAL